MLVRASGNDASLFEAEIAAAPLSRTSDNDVINEVNLQNPAGFVDPASQAKIGSGV
jgi:hypothetical protein